MNINCSLMVSDDDEEGDDAAATLPFRGDSTLLLLGEAGGLSTCVGVLYLLA